MRKNMIKKYTELNSQRINKILFKNTSSPENKEEKLV